MRKYLVGNLKEFAAAEGVSARRAGAMARAGEIPGARKIRGQWQVPLTTQQASSARSISVRTAQRQGKSFSTPEQVLQTKKTGVKRNWLWDAEKLKGYWHYLPDPATHTADNAKDYMLGIARKGPAEQKHRDARKRFIREVKDSRKFWSWGKFDKFVSSDVRR